METLPSHSQDPSLRAGNRYSSSLDLQGLPEWGLLTGEDVMFSPEAATTGQTNTETEKKRTLCSINVLEYINDGGDKAYEKLTEAQNHPAKLTRQEFNELSQWHHELLKDDESADALRYVMLIHDIGKSSRVFTKMGIEEKTVDHDEVMVQLLNNPGYEQQLNAILPTFCKLTDKQQRIVRGCLSVKLNFGQFLQAESPAAALDGIPEGIDERARGIYVLHAIYDIAGVAGHVNPESSIVLTSPVYQSMVRANAALAGDQYSTSVERYDAYLDYRSEQLGVQTEGLTNDEVRVAKAQVRLACMLRYSDPEQHGQLKAGFEQQPAVVQAILTEELNKDGVNDRATLPYYGPAMLKALSDKFDMPTTLTYFAHILQEAMITDKKARNDGETGMVTAELGEIARAVNTDELDPQHAIVRFTKNGELLIPALSTSPGLESLEGLPSFEDGESLRGKKVIVVGMGGGSDGIQAAMLGKVLDNKYGSETSAVVSVRNAEKSVVDAGDTIGSVTQEITPSTRADGNWRFLEGIPLEPTEAGEVPPPVYLLSSIEPSVVGADIEELVKRTGAEVVIGVDTGGDSLYRFEQTTGLERVDTTPDQDLNVLQALSALSSRNPNITVYSSVVAPGVDTPVYAADVLDSASATTLSLDAFDVTAVNNAYTQWRMDGSGSEEGRYGKTPLAWLKALSGQTGIQVLELPVANVVSTPNPWRSFINITPAMSEVVFMDARDHYEAVSA